jgi:hypothetical protein
MIWEDRKERAVLQVMQPRVPTNAQGYERRHGENRNEDSLKELRFLKTSITTNKV